ncbi:ceramidase [Haloflavibacter putidus]|uniref:Ceramidase n=1 Tax=Haloflavibacter putidus TaxID=2576776 RepID=A0A507ZSD4_9FLAO|nr:ceramidase [Haloflavibacter putidus]TQD40540.1 ceramidase [Haloflavibacter putidus]
MFSDLQNFPHDSGPIYQETLAGRFPVEPFNTFSNLLFLVVILYFGRKIYPNYRQHLFLAFCLPILTLGFVGGTIYHATRSAEIWLLLDWVPIVLLCFATAVYFCFSLPIKILFKWIFIVGLLLFQIIVRLIELPKSLSISLGYIASAIAILLPLTLHIWYFKANYAYNILWAVLSFSAAIGFRILDKNLHIFSMGTHWLWHLFGATAVFFLMNYIFLHKKNQAN